MSSRKNMVLKVVIVVDLLITVPLALFFGFFVLVFTDDSTMNTGPALFAGVMSFLLFSAPAMICWLKLNRSDRYTQASGSPSAVSWVQQNDPEGLLISQEQTLTNGISSGAKSEALVLRNTQNTPMERTSHE